MAKRILITTGIFPPEIGGPATYSALLLRVLPSLDYSVKILTYSRVKPPNRAVCVVSAKWPKGFRHFLYFFRNLQLGFYSDIILAADTSFGTAFFSALAAKILRKKFIVRVTGDYAWEQGRQRFGIKELMDDFSAREKKEYPWQIRLLAWCQNFAVKKANLIITPSNYIKNIAVNWGVQEKLVKVIYNAVIVPEIDVTKEEMRRLLKLSGTIILSAGRLVPWKGFELLIKTVADLQKEIPDLKLIIVGSGPEQKKLKTESEKLKIDVLFTGALPKNELAKYLRAANIFVLNTAYEGFSHQIVEAMGMGLPVITTDVGGNPEAVKNGQNGLLVPYNDPDLLRAAIKKLVQNKDERERLGAAGRIAARNFSKETMISKLNETFNSL